MSDRPFDQLRDVKLEIPYTSSTPGSVLISMGRTRVLCTASVQSDVPRWMRESGKGWITAEYAMLPGSSPERVRRDHVSGGRAKEISRLIGRSLRAVVDLKTMGEAMAIVDCDVIEADGGTRTAAVTGAWIALHEALADAVDKGQMPSMPILDEVAAVSVGIVEGTPTLDLDYEKDVAAEVDMNVVMSGRGLLVEVQGTAERAPFTRDELDQLLDLAASGISELHDLQRRAVAAE
ncbi:MAG TPA: ribonuclease PH [Acidimicrobiia bacterium]|nr:rph [Acidimicrobiia bacterium]HYJ24793.1 ribonuclease PH [Acidimicrobiia bacterium]